MKNFLKPTAAMIAVLNTGTLATAQDSATVDVIANVIADETPISITATPIANMGTLTIPNGNGQICVYNAFGGGAVTDESGTLGSNPDTNVCRFTNTPDPMTYEVGCSFGRTVNISVTRTQNPNALAAGVTFLGVATTSSISDFLYTNGSTIDISRGCDVAEVIPGNLGYAVSVPSTAEPYAGSIGQITIDVSY